MAFLDSPVSLQELFGPAIDGFTERFSEAQKILEALRHFMPKCPDIPQPPQKQEAGLRQRPQTARMYPFPKHPTPVLCWTLSQRSHPDLSAERKRRGLVLSKAGNPMKKACISPPLLRTVLSRGDFQARHVLQVQRMPLHPTAVIANPHTKKSISSLPVITIANVISRPLQGELSYVKIEPLAAWFLAWKSIQVVKLDTKYNRTRLLTSVCSQAALLQRCHSNFGTGQCCSCSLVQSANTSAKR